jgi:ABC-2 type transport system permease protein
MKLFLPTLTLLGRELVRFSRQPVRVASIVLAPFLYTLVVSSGLGEGVVVPGMTPGMTFANYIFPGLLVLLVINTALFAPVSTVEDRKEGFLQTVLVAPVSHGSLLLGKVLAGTLLAILQTGVILVFAPLVGVPVTWVSAGNMLVALALVGLAFSSLGFLIAWLSESVHGFQAMVQIFIIPLWLLAGGIVPLSKTSWLAWFSSFNPVSYAVDVVRQAFFGVNPDLIIAAPSGIGCVVLSVVCLVISFALLKRRVNFNI